MAQPYIGEIRMFAGNFAPAGWAFCDGHALPISENEALFQLIGTTYGGDGEETFNLPNLQSRFPMHVGNGFNLAEMAGVEAVTLTTQQIPAHNHPLLASGGPADSTNPNGRVMAESVTRAYVDGTDPDGNLHPSAIAPVGGSQPHDNMQPFVCINFIISLFGIFPSPT